MKYFDFTGKEFLEKELQNYKDYHKAEINKNGSFKLIETYENSELNSLNAFIENELEIKLYFEKYPNLENLRIFLMGKLLKIFSWKEQLQKFLKKMKKLL